MQFTEAQQQDLMLLRRLFFGKLGVLARERRDCLKRMPYGAAATSHEMNIRLSEVVAIAQELHDITAAEYQTKLQFTSAYRRGVRVLCLVKTTTAVSSLLNELYKHYDTPCVPLVAPFPPYPLGVMLRQCTKPLLASCGFTPIAACVDVLHL